MPHNTNNNTEQTPQPQEKWEEGKMLEIHQGNAWRMLISAITRLSIEDKRKEELEDLAFDYGQALMVVSQEQGRLEERERILRFLQK